MVRLKNHTSSSSNSSLNPFKSSSSVNVDSSSNNILLDSSKLRSTSAILNYNPHSLKWNETHTLNEQGFYCYCSQDRYLHEVMLQCHSCLNWFHESCISIPLKNWLPFQLNYIFYCKNCSNQNLNVTLFNGKSINDSSEVFIPTPLTWKDVVITAIANLLAQEVIRIYPPTWTIAKFLKKQTLPSYFIIRDDIVQFIQSNWSILNFNHSLQTEPFELDTCQATVSNILLDSPDLFRTNTETRLTLSPFTLSDANLFHLKPSIHSLSSHSAHPPESKLKLLEKSPSSPIPPSPEREPTEVPMNIESFLPGSLVSTLYPTPNPIFPSSTPSSSTVFIHGPTTSLHLSSSTNLIPLLPSLRSSAPLASSNSHMPTVSTIPSSTTSISIESTSVTSLTSSRWLAPLPPASIHHSSLPTNRDGYKYQLAEPLPCFFEHLSYRSCDFFKPQGPGVFLSKEDRHPSIKVMENGLTCYSDQGFRTIRATVGVQQGTWYFEVFIDRSNRSSLPSSATSHVRLGVCKKEATLLGPVGCDRVGFGYRDRTGEKINQGQLQPYGKPFEPGDVIGVVLHLPPWKAVPMASVSKEKSVNVITTFPNFLSSVVGTPVRIQARAYLELLDYFPSSSASNLHWISIPGSQLVFYKNGVYQGIAFDSLPAPLPILCSTLHSRVPVDPSLKEDGTLGYYPALSCYQGGQATINFGPHFMYTFPSSLLTSEKSPTPSVHTSTFTSWPSTLQRKVPFKKVVPTSSPYCRPYIDRYFEHAIELCVSDMLHEVEAWDRSLNGTEVPSQCIETNSLHPYKRVRVKWALHEQP